MYIGGTDKAGLHHLLWEVLDNAVDEVIHGHADHIQVSLSSDRRELTIKDNGRGIPVEPHPQDPNGRSTLEVIFTELHAGGKFEEGAYKTAGGLHGVGASVVNALSDTLTVSVKRGGVRYTQRFSRGAVIGELETADGVRGTGTEVHFRADERFSPPPFMIRRSSVRGLRARLIFTPASRSHSKILAIGRWELKSLNMKADWQSMSSINRRF